MPGRIEDYALLGDLQTAALVGRDGSIDWLCLPRFDSPACFAALLHDETAGTWRITPASGGRATRRRYRTDTLIVESEWDTPDGAVRVVDFMPPRGEAADVVRIVEGISGAVPVRMLLRLRFDYGHITPWTRVRDTDLAAVAGPNAVWLHGSTPLNQHDDTVTAEFTVRAGQRLSFVLTHTPSHLPQPSPVDAEHALTETEEFWQDWMAGCTYEGPWHDAVRRSLITLKALTYAPTGGIVAAATTSLPEQLGETRNWDYRYCWLRDAAFTLQALLGTGFVEEARAWREWLVRAVAGDPAELRIMYGLDGARRLPEQTLPWLDGYEGSGPVPIGNAAADQFQLDVWGEVLDGLHLARQAGLSARDVTWDLQRGLPGSEGAFLARSFWLADALDGTGRHREALALFEKLLALRNDVGLLSEEYDPLTGRHLGNTPQAFSMVGLINTARQLAGTEGATSASRERQELATTRDPETRRR